MENVDDSTKENLDGSKKSGWSWKKRFFIYAAFGTFAVIVGALLAVGWFVNELQTLKVINKASLVSDLYQSKDASAYKVLFIGNSFTYSSSLPLQFATIYKTNNNKPIKISQEVVPGETIAGHLKRGKVQKMIFENGPWDSVIIQPASYEAKGNYENFKQSCSQLIGLVKHSNARPYMLMTWADKEDFKTQQLISKTFKQLGSDLDTKVIPAGDLWFVSQKNLPQLDLYLRDRHHPNAVGNYLNAILLYKTLTSTMPKSVPAAIPLEGHKNIYLVKLNNEQRDAYKKLVSDFANSY